MPKLESTGTNKAWPTSKLIIIASPALPSKARTSGHGLALSAVAWWFGAIVGKVVTYDCLAALILGRAVVAVVGIVKWRPAPTPG